jgi:hypothetical protein
MKPRELSALVEKQKQTNMEEVNDKIRRTKEANDAQKEKNRAKEIDLNATIHENIELARETLDKMLNIIENEDLDAISKASAYNQLHARTCDFLGKLSALAKLGLWGAREEPIKHIIVIEHEGVDE